jgi:hypothetical protein
MRNFVRFYSSRDKKSKPKNGDMGEACSTNRRYGELYKVLMEKPEGKGPLGRLRSRWG